MTSPICETGSLTIDAENVIINKDYILSDYQYQTTKVMRQANGSLKVKPITRDYTFRTYTKVPKTGVLVVGLGGNNGTTVTGGILANKHNLTWETNRGEMKPNYYGSLTQATTSFLGIDENQKQVYVPFKNLLPMVEPNDLVISGWDINGATLDKAMKRAAVFHANLQDKLSPLMSKIQPLPSIYYPDFIAANQFDRADNILKGKHACLQHLQHIRNDIRSFKKENQLDKVIIMWSANTERYSDVIKGVHDTEENLMLSIKKGHKEIAPSQIFAVAAILEGCAYINGSPQNTFCPAIIQMAQKRNVYISGDDFKSGQTKFKSVLVDFLVSSGIKPSSIVSYNHLGNNDGKNLSAPKQFRSKEISKSNVVDDMVSSNGILFDNEVNEKPDHCVVIKYVPHVRDSKRAMDEYISTIFMNGWNTIVCHNTCEDSLLAAPIIIDLIIMTELFQRIQWRVNKSDDVEEAKNGDDVLDQPEGTFYGFDAVLTILSFLLKAPLVPENSPLVNALMKQRSCIENILRACNGLPPINDMLLEFKTIHNPPQVPAKAL